MLRGIGREWWIQGVLWWSVFVASTLILQAFRSQLDKAHVALVLLLVVLGASAAGGRKLGLSLVLASFFVFHYSFIAPYGTLSVENPLDWVVLIAYLITSLTAAHLLTRARREAGIARQRADEVDRLAALGAEALNAARAEDALQAIAVVIHDTLQVERCEIAGLSADATAWVRATVPAAEGQLPAFAAEVAPAVLHGRTFAVQLADGSKRLASLEEDRSWREGRGPADAVAMLLPLFVHDRAVGVLYLAQAIRLRLTSAQWRLLDALSYYAALGIERVRLEHAAEHVAALREADRLKDALIATVSHDLRTPLTSIKALAREMRSGGDERAEIIEQEADRLNRFVTDLLDLSRLSVGSLPLRIEVNAIDDVVGLALQRVESIFPSHRIDVAFDEPGGLMFGRFDLAQTARILVNLLENACKYGGADRHVDLRIRKSGNDVVFDVADHGTGIPLEDRDRIFEPFYRSASSVPDSRSVGLGLAIAQRLAEAQGSTLTYAERDGGGSVFTLHVPHVDAAQVAIGE
jgi:two-component system, OmpR family, sensor histidine kinase KdpD